MVKKFCSFKKVFCGVLLSTSLIFAASAQAADPTLHEVYAAAEAGRVNDAQRMMEKVLQDHPDSAKAHFVEAELLAKQGRTANATTELRTAESLAPGLPFAKPEAVQKLRQRIAGESGAVADAPMMHAATAAPSNDVSWTALLLGIGLIAAIIYFARAVMSRRGAPVFAAGTGAAGYPGAMSGAGNGSMQPTPMQPAGTAGSGIGSGILGGLATGAAVGAGMVAGEALVHHLMDGNRSVGSSMLPPENYVPENHVPENYANAPDDMGGDDFGVSDSSSWDDGVGGGGDDNW